MTAGQGLPSAAGSSPALADRPAPTERPTPASARGAEAAARLAGLRSLLARGRDAAAWPADLRPGPDGPALEPLPDAGLAHDHIRLLGTPWLARLPKQSQMGLPPAENLRYQAACFVRAAAGGHAPRLGGVLPAGDELPRGGLLVEAIDGRPVDLARADDRRAMVEALAALHALPLPPPDARAPLLDPAAPLIALRDELQAQALHLAAAGLAPASRDLLEAALDRFAGHPALGETDRCLVAFDAHPGNFLIAPDGRAVLVDLEKARYGHPGCDLAHATLYTSTTWPVGGGRALDAAQVEAACRDWARRVGPQAARRWWPTLALARLGMALWAFTWCAKWQVLSGSAAAPGREGEDWSAEQSDADLVRHVRQRVGHYLSPAVVRDGLQGCEDLGWRLKRAV